MIRNQSVFAVSGDTEALRRISDVVELSTDEKPYIAHIADRDRLAEDQQFFENSRQGDILVFYKKARLAILYRPDTRKVVTVTQVDFGDTGVVFDGDEIYPAKLQKESSAVSVTDADSQVSIDDTDFRVVVLNGSGRNGASASLKAALSTWLDPDNITVGNTQEAYSQTFIVNRNNAGPSTMEKLGQYIQGQVISSLPDGELPQDADVVIILGTDGR